MARVRAGSEPVDSVPEGWALEDWEPASRAMAPVTMDRSHRSPSASGKHCHADRSRNP